MALPQIPLNGRCAGDDRRSTCGSASTRSDCSGPNRGSQAHPKVTIGNSVRVHYGEAHHIRLLLRCGCVEASERAQRTGIRQTRGTSSPETRAHSVERDHRVCFHLLRGSLRLPDRPSLSGLFAQRRRKRERRLLPICGGRVLHPADAVFRSHFLHARAEDLPLMKSFG